MQGFYRSNIHDNGKKCLSISDKREKEANQKEQLWVWSLGIDMTCNQAIQKKNMWKQEQIGRKEAKMRMEKKKR